MFYLLSSYPLAHDSAERYRKRWSIEVFFKQLKTAGFQLESTGISKPERLQMLMAVASVAYVTVLDEGAQPGGAGADPDEAESILAAKLACSEYVSLWTTGAGEQNPEHWSSLEIGLAACLRAKSAVRTPCYFRGSLTVE